MQIPLCYALGERRHRLAAPDGRWTRLHHVLDTRLLGSLGDAAPNAHHDLSLPEHEGEGQPSVLGALENVGDALIQPAGGNLPANGIRRERERAA